MPGEQFFASVGELGLKLGVMAKSHGSWQVGPKKIEKKLGLDVSDWNLVVFTHTYIYIYIEIYPYLANG